MVCVRGSKTALDTLSKRDQDPCRSGGLTDMSLKRGVAEREISTYS